MPNATKSTALRRRCRTTVGLRWPVVPHSDWREQMDLGTFASNGGIVGDASVSGPYCRTPPGKPVTCVTIDWPAPIEGEFFENLLPFGPHSWFGGLSSNQTDGSGRQYKRNRYYDPATGRFTQEDPLGLAGGLNLYGFADGNPLSYSDPFGLCPPKEYAEVFMCTGELLKPWVKPLEVAGTLATLPAGWRHGHDGQGNAALRPWQQDGSSGDRCSKRGRSSRRCC